MSESSMRTHSISFKTGWWLLLILLILVAAGHLALLFAIPGDELLFLGWAALPLYAAVVLLIPYRRGEKWSWSVTWIMIAVFALTPLWNSEQGSMYLGMAGVMAPGQVLTFNEFFGKRRKTEDQE